MGNSWQRDSSVTDEIAQENYEGSSTVENGNSTTKVLNAMVEDDLHEDSLFMYSYPDDSEKDEFMEFAREKNFVTHLHLWRN